MMGVPIDKVERIIKPEERLKGLRETYYDEINTKVANGEELDYKEELLSKLFDLSDFFHYVADISYDDLGISGSILPGLQKAGTSILTL